MWNDIKSSSYFLKLRELVYLLFIHPVELLKEQKRKKSKLNDYSSLKKFKGIHRGERCFIIATGPSLTEDDFKKLKNEYTIGVNALCFWFIEKKMETDYFVISDDDVYARVESVLQMITQSEIFISERVMKTHQIDKNFNIFPVDIWNRFIQNDNKKKLSNDISICSYDEETVVIHAIQLALYLGFKEIYLLGTDCNYNQTKQYAINHGKKVDKFLGNKMIKSYSVVKNYEKIFGFKVYNATRGGMLDIFPRVNLDDLL